MFAQSVVVLLIVLVGCSAKTDFADEDGQLLSASLKSFCEVQKIKNGNLLSSFYELKISTRLRPFEYYLCKSHENLLREIYSSEFVNDDSVFGSRTLAIRDELQVTNYSSPALDCPVERFLLFIDDLIRIKYGYLPEDLLSLEKLAEMLKPVEPLPDNLKFVFRYENSSVFYWKPLVIESKFVYDTNRIFFDVEASATLEYSLMIPLFDDNHRAHSDGCVKAEELPDSARDELKIRKFNGSSEIPKDEIKSYVDVLALLAKDELRSDSLPPSASELRSLCETRKINGSYLVNSYYRLDLLYFLDFLPEVRDLYKSKSQDVRDALYFGPPHNLTEIKLRRKNFADQFMSLRRRVYSENFIEKSSNLSDEIKKAASELETLKKKYLDEESERSNETAKWARPGGEPFLMELFNYDQLKYYLGKLDRSYVSRLESGYLVDDLNLEPILRLYQLHGGLESAFRNKTSSIFKAEPLVLFYKLEADSEQIVRYARAERFFKAYFSLFIPMYNKEADFAHCVPPRRLPRFFAQN